MFVDTLLVSAENSDLSTKSVTNYNGVVIMGGPMGALDDSGYPSLAQERDLIRDAVQRGTPVLGICLGHQLIAVALGGELLAGATEEIGVGAVELTIDSLHLGEANCRIPVLHWHRDNVTAPPGATVLATSPGCPVQAFRLGSAIGVQFHVELTPAVMDDWLREPTMAADLPHGLGPARLSADFDRSKNEMTAVGDRLINAFLSDVLDSQKV